MMKLALAGRNLVLAAAATVMTSGIATAQEPTLEPTLEMRLDRMVERLEADCEKFHVPGMAIAVVLDDEIVLARGFGVANVETGAPATDQTLFAVGSTTKAFTASLIGMLVDEGTMAWDDPVRKHLPEFRLADAEVDAQVTIRDLLCHRTGLASMTVLWYGGNVTSAELIEALGRPELLHPFRERFNYQNLCFLAAGEASARAAGMTWDALVAERLFAPLGMTSSYTSLEATQADPRLALGYRWDEADGALVHQPMRSVTSVAPAGAINSNVRDMAQWVRLQLGRGAFEGTQLLSEAQHAETWTPHIDVGGDIAYGLGWFLRDWKGKRVIEHAGGIDGFTAEVAMIPEENLGFVCLMNLFASPVQESSRTIVFESMLGAWEDDAERITPSEDFDRFVGTYIGNFGSFSNTKFKVLEQADGTLAIDVPGQMVYELRPPDGEGKRYFALTDQIALKFTENDEGEVVSLSMFQAGMEFELPREGVEIAPEIDVAAVQRYLGKYHSETLGTDVTVLTRNGRLAVDVPGQMVYELRGPGEDGRWTFRVRASIWLTFVEGDDGEIASMTMVQEGLESSLPRVAGADPDVVVPDVDTLLELTFAAQGLERAELRSLHAVGRVRLVHMGIDGRIETVAAADDRLRNEIDLGRYGHIRTIVNGDAGMLDSTMMPRLAMSKDMLDSTRVESPFTWLSDWRETFDEITIGERTELDGTPVDVLRLQRGDGPVITLMLDAETHLPAGRRSMSTSAVGMQIEITQRFDDYRPVGGIMVPHRVDTRNELSGSFLIEWERIEANVAVNPELFDLDADADAEREPELEPAGAGAGVR